MATKLGSNEQQEFDPKYEWQENAANFLLKLHLAGFRKEDFRVQVDGAGRLTVRGQRADGSKHVRFHKVFQLPPTSNLEDISGRFDAGVLSLTVPKRPAASPPTTIGDIISKQQPTTKKKAEQQHKEPQPQQEDDEATKKKAEDKKPQQEDEANKKLQQEDEAKKKLQQEEEAKKKLQQEEDEAKKKLHKQEDEAKKKLQQQEDEAKQETEPKAPETEEESVLERVKRHAEKKLQQEEEKELAERQRTQQQCGGWKQRVAEELQGLASSEWAEGVVETVKKNKEAIAVAVAAFSLGLFVSSKLCSRNN